jgi:hypothetical protein
MAPNQPFTIASVAPTLTEFQKLPAVDQGIAFLKRLAHLFPRGKTFKRSNLALPAYGTPDAHSLCTGWPREELVAAVPYLLGIPWRTIERDGFIAESLSGDGHFELTEDGWALVASGMNVDAPDRAAIAALRFLHPNLQGYGHYFRERKLKDAVTAAFLRVENRLNETRDASLSPAAKGVSGVSLPYKLFDTGDLKFPYPKLAADDSQSREAYAKQLKGIAREWRWMVPKLIRPRAA